MVKVLLNSKIKIPSLSHKRASGKSKSKFSRTKREKLLRKLRVLIKNKRFRNTFKKRFGPGQLLQVLTKKGTLPKNFSSALNLKMAELLPRKKGNLIPKKKFLSLRKSTVNLTELKIKTGLSWRKKTTNFEKLFFFLGLKPILSLQAYKLFLLMELQLNSLLLRAQLVPFFFLVTDLCFYRLVFVNRLIVSDPHLVVSLYDSVQLPIFLYQALTYRQNRFFFYPWFLQKFFKIFWGQFTDYNMDKMWIVSNYLSSRVTGEALVYSFPNFLLYLAPFRRFSKLYYRPQPDHLKNREAGLSYTYTVFKLNLFNYANFYK